MKSRRRPWQARARRALRRFTFYCNAVDQIEIQKGRGATPQGMAWRLPDDQIREIFGTGGEALRAFNQKRLSRVPHDQIERLERILVRLAAADDWMSRLKKVSELDSSAKTAFERLVRPGCVPDPLVYCIEQQERSISRAARKDTKHLGRRRKLKELLKAFERLANQCDEYMKLSPSETVEHYDLSSVIPRWLWKQAQTFRDFLDDCDPRRQTKRPKSDFALFQTMQDIKTMTGSFQDDLLAAVLSGTPDVAPTTAEALRRWRAREVTQWRRWRPPTFGQDEGYPRLIP